MKKCFDIIVIGAGPAGITASLTAAAKGRRVLLLEGNSRVGKKLLSTGNGKCNFTNETVSEEHYYSHGDPLINSVLAGFGRSELISWMRAIGIEEKTVSGRIYPRSEQASSVLDALRIQLDLSGVTVVTGAKVQYLSRNDDGLFEAQTTEKIYTGRKVILAAGSKAAPGTGSDGSGYVLARQMGLKVAKPRPALTNVHLDESFCKSWSGVRCDGQVSVLIDGVLTASDTGQLQMTSYGISGIPVFQISRYVSAALEEGREVKLELSFLPGCSRQDAVSLLESRQGTIGDYRAGDILLGVLPKNLAGVLIRLSGIDRSASVGGLSRNDIGRLASVLTSMKCRADGTGGFNQAQVCAGGILKDELDASTLECRRVPGLYAAGELIDVDGMCGGYNLQWAFSSGYTAGASASS